MLRVNLNLLWLLQKLMTALKHLHYKDFSLKATGCKKELKEREQVIRIQNSLFLA